MQERSGVIGKPTAYFRVKARQNPEEILGCHVLRTAGKGGAGSGRGMGTGALWYL